jgi:hypothetical protein
MRLLRLTRNSEALFRERFHASGQARERTRCGVAVHHALLRAAHDFGLRILEGLLGRIGISGSNRDFNLLDEGANAADTVAVDDSLSLRTENALFCRFDIGHELSLGTVPERAGL